MKAFEELHLNRCNVQVEDDIKDWYMYKAKTMGMNMSQLMAFVLAQWYEQHINAETLRLLADFNKGVDVKEINESSIALLNEIQKVQENELKNNENNEKK